MVERIREVARKLDYHPHPYAASLRTARSSIVGVIVPRLQDFVLATIYEGIEEAAIENRLSTFVTNSLDRPENQRTAASMMLNRRVDGMIFGDAHLDDPFLDELAARDIPFVLANRHAGKHVSVTCNDYLGGRLVAEHLLAIGCRDLAIVAGQSFTSMLFVKRASECLQAELFSGNSTSPGGATRLKHYSHPVRSRMRSSQPMISLQSAHRVYCVTMDSVYRWTSHSLDITTLPSPRRCRFR
jgi:LacI family transcriptional regulator